MLNCLMVVVVVSVAVVVVVAAVAAAAVMMMNFDLKAPHAEKFFSRHKYNTYPRSQP